jgi:hypothetical protein
VRARAAREQLVDQLGDLLVGVDELAQVAAASRRVIDRHALLLAVDEHAELGVVHVHRQIPAPVGAVGGRDLALGDRRVLRQLAHGVALVAQNLAIRRHDARPHRGVVDHADLRVADGVERMDALVDGATGQQGDGQASEEGQAMCHRAAFRE